MEICPVIVGEGRLAIGHRPGKAMLPALHVVGVTHIATLLGSSEGAEDLIRRIESEGFLSLWLPLADAKPIDDPKQIAHVIEFFAQLENVLKGGATVFLHCSAGIHRTGMIANGFLRSLGYSSSESLEQLREMRSVTSDGVTEQRLRWGDQFALVDGL